MVERDGSKWRDHAFEDGRLYQTPLSAGAAALDLLQLLAAVGRVAQKTDDRALGRDAHAERTSDCMCAPVKHFGRPPCGLRRPRIWLPATGDLRVAYHPKCSSPSTL